MTHGQAEAKLEGRLWPTDDRRPGETVGDWCRRLDGYVNAPHGVDDDETEEVA